MNKKQKSNLKKFIKSWSKASDSYKAITGNKNHRLCFPDPIQKLIIEDVFPNKYKKNNSSGKTYDYTDVATGTLNVEVKSSSGSGVTPFKKNQNQCNVIIYLDIDSTNGQIVIHELSSTQVNIVNSIVANKPNITLANYLTGSVQTIVKL